ncbi:MAG: cytochrome d ubiquinol oxidase subunit II [Bacillota bacterium]|nr:cytochrome d ubiquinol oxidase subunit II [Bacillota bacterium]
MDLNTLWFALIVVLFVGYFFLEGFDYGVGILLPWLGRSDRERRVLLNTVGPHWDGNEVWLLTAGGAMFAAFPNWYATLFSGFYLALVLMLLALIVRGVGFEYRSRDESPRWRNAWDWAIFAGSLVPALLWGVALANLVRGLPIDQQMNYRGSLFTLLNPYGLLGGLFTLLAFTLHGALFLLLKTEGEMRERARAAARWVGALATAVAALFALYSYFATGIFQKPGLLPGALVVVGGLALLAVRAMLDRDRAGWAFVLNGVTIVAAVATIFLGLYPNVMISNLNPAWNLTIHNASSSPYTLKVMSIVAVSLVPFVLAYQAWTYWVFRKRVGLREKLTY